MLDGMGLLSAWVSVRMGVQMCAVCSIELRFFFLFSPGKRGERFVTQMICLFACVPEP